MGEVALGVESLGDGLMVGELLAVVIGERVDKVGMRLQYCEQGVRDGLCRLVGSLGNDAVACPALSQREQDGAAGLADHGVGLPVSGAGVFLDDLRPLFYSQSFSSIATVLMACFFACSQQSNPVVTTTPPSMEVLSS